jgi:hypothetical protein
MHEQFDTEFKLYLHNKGINIDSNIFDVKFNPPQNFASYRQAVMDTARVNTFNVMMAIPFVSNRFAMKRFLGLTAEEIAENEKMWKEENVDADSKLSASAELRSAGITAGGLAGDLGGMTDNTAPPEDTGEGMPGADGAPNEAPPPPPPQ